MEKRFDLSGTGPGGFPLIHLVEPGSAYGLSQTAGLSKTASGEHLAPVVELLESIQPQEDRLYLVNSALGAGEYVGFNLRGDWFTEAGLKHTPPGWHSIPVWDIDARRRAANTPEDVPGYGPMVWGYPSFYNAHRFRHHRNDCPSKAYGLVLGAFYDDRMHRVILVSELIRRWCAERGALDVYDRIARGDFVDTSIGARVPDDECSVCKHMARSPAQYCRHVQRGALPPYGMGKLLADGRRCGVYNHYPLFFDDSFVFIGAERSAKVMDNVTPLLKGERTYTSTIYTPPRRMRRRRAVASTLKAASPLLGQDAPDEQQLKDVELGRALVQASNPPAMGAHSGSLGDKISRLLSVIPTLHEKQDMALQHVAERMRRKEAIREGTLEPSELQFWEQRQLHALGQKGVSQEDVSQMQAVVSRQMRVAFGRGGHKDHVRRHGLKKSAMSLAKWAEHLKRIPVPSESQLAIIADHADRLPQLPPHVLDFVGEDMPSRCEALVEMGVVLQPEEFAYTAAPRMGVSCPHRRAELLHTPLPPVPIHPSYFPSPRWSGSVPGSLKEDLLKLMKVLMML